MSSIDFVTITSSESSTTYNAHYTSFPKILNKSGEIYILMDCFEKSIGQYTDLKTAEVAAKTAAMNHNLPYIPANTSVITSIQVHPNKFMIIELTSEGGILNKSLETGQVSSIAAATALARSRGLPLLLPK